MTETSGIAGGVPYFVRPPATGPRSDAPVVIAYHMLAPPCTESAMAAAVPLTGLDAWKIYLGLPMSGSRLPAGGAEELGRLLGQDAVLRVHRQVTLGAVEEFRPAYEELRARLKIDDDVPLGVLGGSMGGAVAQLVAAESGLPFRAAVLVNPVVRFRDAIDGISAMMGGSYAWSPESDAVAERVDFVRRAGELGGTAVRFVTGENDWPDAIVEPVALAVAATGADWQVVPGMGHPLAEEPGVEPAPQTPQAKVVDRLAVEWFRAKL